MLSSAVMERKEATAWMSQQSDDSTSSKVHRDLVADNFAVHVFPNGRCTSAVENIVISSVASYSRNEFHGDTEELRYAGQMRDRVNASYSYFRNEIDDVSTTRIRVGRVNRRYQSTRRIEDSYGERGRWLSIRMRRESRYRLKQRWYRANWHDATLRKIPERA